MKRINPLVILFLICGCTKKTGILKSNESSAPVAVAVVKNCSLSDTVTYANTVKAIFMNNCMPCHASPGDGGFNLDAYQPSVDLAKSGELMEVIQYRPNDIMMPPPPQKRLDSCEIKALTLWIKQGYRLN